MVTMLDYLELYKISEILDKKYQGYALTQMISIDKNNKVTQYNKEVKEDINRIKDKNIINFKDMLDNSIEYKLAESFPEAMDIKYRMIENNDFSKNIIKVVIGDSMTNYIIDKNKSLMFDRLASGHTNIFHSSLGLVLNNVR